MTGFKTISQIFIYICLGTRVCKPISRVCQFGVATKQTLNIQLNHRKTKKAALFNTSK